MKEEKRKLMQVRQESGLTSQQVADKAGLPLREIYKAEIGIAVEDETATKILFALMELTGKIYTRGNTEIFSKNP